MAVTRLLFVALSVVLLSCHAQDPSQPYPAADAYLPSTSILDHSSYVESFDDKNWLLANIPFVDFPDKSVQDVYYYRTAVVKRSFVSIREMRNTNGKQGT